MTTIVQKSVTDKEARALLKVQLAEYLAGHPETQFAHTWMKRAEAVWLGIVIAAFASALYGSFAWANANPIMIAPAWFAFAACLSLLTALNGLHAILIRAFPPVILPGKVQKFVSGSGAVWIGGASIVGGLILAGLWVAFAYYTAASNLTILIPLINALGIVVSIGILIAIVFAVYQKISQS